VLFGDGHIKGFSGRLWYAQDSQHNTLAGALWKGGPKTRINP